MYISLKLGSYTVHHGYKDKAESIEEFVKSNTFTEKIIKIERILSFTEKTVLISSGFGRETYWEYEGGLDLIKKKLDCHIL